ncbi:MAG: PilT/PilU family type 4a pilus ATPase, partial [Myxococcales bacterium]
CGTAEAGLRPGAGRPTDMAFLSLVRQARERKASDMHLSAGQPPLFRTAGELLRVGEVLDQAALERMLMPLLNAPQQEQLRERGYVDFAIDLEAAGRLRVNISTQRTGLKGSFRLIMHPTPTLDELGLPKEIARVTTYHQGLVVIAGPNGHGKTTTMAAIVDLINASRPHHILTVEEPVEFIHARKQAVISQREVGSHTRSFAAALKASLREDPDVIVIGELRDRETVEIALTAAETGHLVMVTMSTPSAAKTIDRIIDFFPPDEQPQVRASLAGALKFIVAQRLVPAASGEGFVAAVELLTGVPPLWALIRDNKLFQLPSLQQRGRAYGMIRFDDSLAELARTSKITPETALACAENRKELANVIKLPTNAPLPGATPHVAVQAAQVATTTAAQGIQDLKSKVGNLFGGSKKE